MESINAENSILVVKFEEFSNELQAVKERNGSRNKIIQTKTEKKWQVEIN